MPLDPAVAIYLQEIADSGYVPVEQQPDATTARRVVAARRSGRQLDVPPIGRTMDIAVPGPDGPVKARVYWPHSEADPVGLLVYYHGGGWVLDGIEGTDTEARRVCNAGACLVASIEYRLAPEHRFPAAHEDAYAAAAWFAENAKEFGQSADVVGVGGVSAGGNLAAGVSQMALERGGPEIALQLLVVPNLRSENESQSWRDYGDGYLMTRANHDWYIDQYFGGRELARHPLASPVLAESVAGLPPTLVITAEFDPLRDDAEQYARRLREAGVGANTIRFDGMIHGFIGPLGAHPAVERAFAVIGEFLRDGFSPRRVSSGCE